MSAAIASVKPDSKMSVGSFFAKNFLWITLVILFAIATITSGGAFLQPRNLINVLAQNSVAGVLAVGQTLVILTAGIDLSLGAITSLTAMVVLMSQGQNVFVSLCLGLSVGLLCGVVNGLLVSIVKIPPFVGTLGMMQVATGITYIISKGVSFYEDEHVSLFFGYDNIGPIPGIVIVWAGVSVLGWYITKRTRYGEYIYAVGGNPKAARASGIPVGRTLVFVYTFAGLCAAVAAILSVNRLGYTQPNIGDALGLASIAPVVVGGTSLFGGVGGVWRNVAGVLIVGLLNNVMVLLGVNQSIQQAVQGGIILFVVFLFVRQQIQSRKA